LEPYREEFENAGTNLVYVAAEKREGMFKPLEHLATHPISFPFLFDEDRRITKSYGVYQRLGVDAINIARPATFVIDRNGIIRYLFVGMSQTSRAPVEEVLGAVKSLRTSEGEAR
jgi:peroxiredoxin